MANSTVTSPAPSRRHRWLRVIGWIVAVLVVLIVVAYFVGTSSAFLKAVILPKASEALNAKITVSDASISPFHEVILRNLKVQTTGTEPLLTAPEVRLRYSLMDIIGGNINVDEVAVSAPAIVLVQNPDGTSNLDPILKGQKAKPAQPAQPSKPSKPLRLDIKKIALTEATLRQVKLYKGNFSDTTELSHLTVTIENVKNGQTGKLALNSDLSMRNNPPPPGTNGLLQANIQAGYTFGLTPDLKPSAIQGNARVQVSRAEGALAQVNALATTLDCDVTPTDIRHVTLTFQKADTRLGELRVSGPFDMQNVEGKLKVEIIHIDKNLLNLAGAPSGIDFGPTTIDSTNEIDLAKGGSAITTVGQLDLSHLQLTRTNETTPPLDLQAKYDVSVDKAAGTALLRAFDLSGSQNGNQFLQGQLTSPMNFNWGSTAGGGGNAALKVTVTRFDLANWKVFLGEVAPAGLVNLQLELNSHQGGKQLGFDLNSQIDDLTAGSGSNQISGATVTLQVAGTATNLNQFNLSTYKFQVSRQNQPLVVLSGAGTCDQTAKTADLQLDGQFLLARLLQALPRPDLSVSSGSAQIKARLTQNQSEQNITGNFALTDFTGLVGSNSFKSFGATADLDVTMNTEQVQIRKIAGNISQANNPGGAFNLSGTYGLSNKVAALKATLTGFNQNGLGPFLQPALADKQLKSIDLNADATVQYDPQAASSVKAGLQVTNLVVSDPKGQFPATPLAATMLLDGSLNQKVLDLRQCQLGLTPTARATNQVDLTGHIDMSQTNITGNVKLAADSLDFTSYYDLFAGPSKTAPPAQAAPSPSQPASAPSAPAGPETEAPAKQFPLSNFTAEASIHHLYLHEVDIADFLATAKIDGGHVILDPFKLSLNGAPVNSVINLDLGIPGYKYDLSFSAQGVPLAPLVDSFQPDRKGQIGGAMVAQAKINGAGTTGASLQKNLAGQFDVASTNLNLSVINIRSPILKTIINVVAVLPELVRNPASSLGSVLGAVMPGQGAGKTGSLSDELQKSPIDQIIARGTIGSGTVNLQEALIQSAAFQAQAEGTVALAAVLTNSAIQIPVSVSLSRSIADRVNLTPANADTNVAYVKLPQFLTLTGTVGQPKENINKLALAGTVFKGISGIVPGGTASDVLRGLGGLLGGNTTAGTNAPQNTATNAPGQSINNLLHGIFGPKK